MVCHHCGRTVQQDDRFCTGCGRPLHRAAEAGPAADASLGRDAHLIADEPTERMPSIARQAPLPVGPATPATGSSLPADDHWDDDDPVWAPTGSLPVDDDATAVGGFTLELPPTEPVTDVWSVPIAEPADPADAGAEPTRPAPAVASTAEIAFVPRIAAARPRFRPGAVTLIALLGGIVALVSLFADVVSITSDTRLLPTDQTPFGFRTGAWIVDDLADNLSIAGLLAVLLMVAGGVAAAFGWRWGSGLAGGAGLSIAGLSALALGLAQIPIDAAHEFAAIPSEQQFTLTITRDLGYWLLLAAGAIGIVLFFAAVDDAWGDRRGGLNPWIAAVGALAVVVAAAGPLLPEGQAVFSDNWYLTDGPGEAPALLLAGRLVQLGLLLLAGVIGFLSVRRWGLGLAVGGAVPFVWQAVSTLFELTERPVGPGFRNPGADGMHLHGVTIIGVSAVAALAILAAIAAYDQGIRERP